MRVSRMKRPVILIVALGLLLSGCGSSGYRGPITTFQSAATVVNESTRLYLTQLNKVERDKYIQEQLSIPDVIDLRELEKVQLFSKEGLNARLEALDQLARYGDLLSRLANSDAPARIKASAVDLSTAIGNLSQTVSGLAGADDAKFRAAAGPVTTIVSEILDLIIQQKIKEALDKAIQNGEQPINNLLAAIGDDITIAYERRRNAFSALRVALRDDYMRELKKKPNHDPERIRLLAERIPAHEDLWEAFGNSNPKAALSAMARAHSALVTYAKSSHEVNDFAALVEAMEAFAARAMVIGQAVQELRNLNR
jgi:hypothetical protein